MTAPLVVPALENGSAPPPDGALPGSLLSDLRARAAAQQAERHLDLPIGGDFGDVLVARYGVLDVHELERYTKLQGNTGDVELSIELLVTTCRGLYARDGDRLVELRDDKGAVRYGHRLAVLLAMPLSDDGEKLPPREIVLKLFGGNAMQLGAHVSRVVEWMSNPGGDAPGPFSVATP